MKKISVVINTYNAEQHLRKVLDALTMFDEVLICDMESTDNTLIIAKEYGCRIVTFPKSNHKSAEPARTFAIQSASHPWVLVIDADEIVPDNLRQYLYDYIERPNCAQGLYIPRQNMFMGKFIKCAYPDFQLRFFIREGTEWPPYVHTFPKVNGRKEVISQKHKELSIIHLANDSIKAVIEKDNRYSDNEVEKKKDKHYGTLALIYRPFWQFFKYYVLKGGWRDGVNGLIYSGLKAYYQFIIVAKIVERNRNEDNIANINI